MPNDSNHVVIIDVHSIGYAVFHAMGELDYHGQRTGVIYGFFYQLLTLATKFNTSQFVFCWDSRKSRRKGLYPGYKNRPKNNSKELTTGEVLDREAFYAQLGEIRLTWFPRLGFQNNFLYVGLEADDTIALVLKYGTYPKQWSKNIHWIIASTDRDLYQLLAPNVSIYANKELFTYQKFIQKYGIYPKYWNRAKALGGCNSDTVEGVAGIADPAKSQNSRALQYLRGELKGAYLERIESKEGKRIYRRNLKLVTLPIINSLRPIMRYDTFCLDDFVDMFDTLDFRSFFKEDIFSKWIHYFGLRRSQGTL